MALSTAVRGIYADSVTKKMGDTPVAWRHAQNVVAGGTDNFGDVFLREFVAMHSYRISQRAERGEAANRFSNWPLLASGGHMALTCYASNLVDRDSNGTSDFFVATQYAVFSSGFGQTLTILVSSGPQVRWIWK